MGSMQIAHCTYFYRQKKKGQVRPSPPVHHSAAAFTVTSSGGSDSFIPFKYSAILLNLTPSALSIHETYANSAS